MADFIAQFGGIGLAFLGAALAVGLCCVGSARGRRGGYRRFKRNP
mgnify:CR=1 FL=1